jgi:4-carboxymuconolactone decarboxylase
VNDDLFNTGLSIRREVLGAEYVDANLAAADDFTRDFQRLVTEYCWGAAWGRDALTRRDRSLLNLAMLGALNRPAEFKVHLRGALTNGCTRDEIKDTLIQLAVYAGIPAGVEAFRIARGVFAEVDAEAESQRG